MTDNHTLDMTVKGQTVFRRDYEKPDGRMLRLYGYKPHIADPISDSLTGLASGGELRWHPLRGEWNIYAPHRQNRTFKPTMAKDPLAPATIDGADTEFPFADFELGVFENKFTSLHAKAPEPEPTKGVIKQAAQGHCDVIVYGPDAQGNLHSLGQDKRRLLVAAWSDRYQTLFSQGHKFVLPFENRGDEVGVTLHHPHGQIYAFSFIPDTQARMLTAFDEGYNMSDDIKSFGQDFEVAKAGGMTAFCPPFARFPYEVWITPDTFSPGPWAFDETQADGFAHLLGDITRRYDAFFERETAYMLCLHAAPSGHEDTFHFTAQFYPLLRSQTRVKYLASVEQATGVFTVDVMPKSAADALRSL